MGQVETDRLTLVIASDAHAYDLWLVVNGASRRNTQYVSSPEWLYGHGRVNVEIDSFPLWWTEEDMTQLETIMERSSE